MVTVRRRGSLAAFGVAIAAAAAEAALIAVLGSLTVVSAVASRVRPGAGTLFGLTLIVSIALRAFFQGPAGIDGLKALAAICAPPAAFAGSALAVNYAPRA